MSELVSGMQAIISAWRQQIASCHKAGLYPAALAYKACVADLLRLVDKVEELEAHSIELERRNSGMSGMLCRVRTKADIAGGYYNESGGLDEATIKGRGTGCEQAVGLLIARHAGALATIARYEAITRHEDADE